MQAKRTSAVRDKPNSPLLASIAPGATRPHWGEKEAWSEFPVLNGKGGNQDFFIVNNQVAGS